LLAAAFLALVAAGCAVDVPTSPDTFSLDAKGASHLRRPQSVALSNGYETEAKKQFSVGHGVTWAVDQKQLTETAVVMLKRSFEKHGITPVAQGDKSVLLRVRADNAFVHSGAFVAHSNVRLVLEAQFGDGTSTSIPGDNQSPMGAQRAFDGAVLFALNGLLSDERFVAYLNR
jgi:hypothetical protein